MKSAPLKISRTKQPIGAAQESCWIYFVIISLPKGVSANAANLKCCFANGMPMMVIPNNSPKARCVKQIHAPPINIHIRFMIVGKQPVAFSLTRVSFPKGHKANPANFKVWSPNGMPIMLMKSIRLDTKYSKATISPPKTNQIIFPKNFK